MMSPEGFPAAAAPEAAEAPVFDDDYFLNTFGLGPSETNAVVEFNGHQGSVAAMLTDDKCPVGGALAAAYKENGLAGVEHKAAALKEVFSKDVIPQTSDETRGFHNGTVSRDKLFEFSPGKPNFLV